MCYVTILAIILLTSGVGSSSSGHEEASYQLTPIQLEALEAPIEAQENGSRQLYDQSFFLQKIDPAWSEKTEVLLRGFLEESVEKLEDRDREPLTTTIFGVQVSVDIDLEFDLAFGVECRTSMCRVELKHTNEWDFLKVLPWITSSVGREISANIPSFIEKMSFCQVVSFFELPHYWVVYLVREGHSILP